MKRIAQAVKATFLVSVCFISSARFALAGDLAEVLQRGELRHLGIPYANFVTGSGDGMDVDIMRGFAESLGVKYRFVQSDWAHIFPDLLGQTVTRKGDEVLLGDKTEIKGDVIANGLTVLPWRQKIVDYSTPTFPSQVWLVARAESAVTPISGGRSVAEDIVQTKGKIGNNSLLVLEQTCLDPALYNLNNKGYTIKPYTRSSNLNEMVPAILNRDAELTLLDVPDAMMDLAKWSGRIKVIGPVSDEQVMGVAFAKSAPELRAKFNLYLQKIRDDGTYDQLIRKYYPGIATYFPAFFQTYGKSH